MSALPKEVLNTPTPDASLSGGGNGSVAVREVGKNLAGAGECFEAPADVRKFVFLCDKTSTLYVDENEAGSMRVHGYEALLRVWAQDGDLRAAVAMKTVPHTELKELFETSAASASSADVAGPSNSEQSEIASMLLDAVKVRASDIHFIPDGRSTWVAFRIHGVLVQRYTLEREHAERLIRALYTGMCEKEQNYDASRRQHATLYEKHAHAAGLHLVRLSTAPSAGGVSMALRLCEQSNGKWREPVDMGYLPEQAEIFEDVLRERQGVVIFTGTTGSGKSASMANFLRREMARANGQINVITLEDPPEQKLQTVVEEQGKKKVYTAVQYAISQDDDSEDGRDRAWASWVEYALRHDPDYVVVGEMRGRAAMAATLRSAITGHLTWTTLHVKDAFTYAIRLLESGVGADLVFDPSVILSVTNQSLVPTLCPDCKVPYLGNEDALSERLRGRVGKHCDVKGVYLRGAGCPSCSAVVPGIAGRTLCAEVLKPSAKLMSILRDQGALAAQRYWIAKMGGITQAEHLRRLISQGKVDPAMGEYHVRPIDDDDRFLLEAGNEPVSLREVG